MTTAGQVPALSPPHPSLSATHSSLLSGVGFGAGPASFDFAALAQQQKQRLRRGAAAPKTPPRCSAVYAAGDLGANVLEPSFGGRVAVPSLSRMLTLSDADAEAGADAGSGSGEAERRAMTAEFQRKLVRATSSQGGKRKRGAMPLRTLSRPGTTAGRRQYKFRIEPTTRRPLTTGTANRGTNVYLRFPGVEPERVPIFKGGGVGGGGGGGGGVGNKHNGLSSSFGGFTTHLNMFDESLVGKYSSLGRPLSPLVGYSAEELEENRRRVEREEAARIAAELAAAKKAAAEEEERRRAEEEIERLRKEEEERARRELMEAKLREEGEFKRKKEEAERLKRLEAERLQAEQDERDRLLAAQKAREAEEARARQDALDARRAAEESKKRAEREARKREKRSATIFQKMQRGNAARKLFEVKKREKVEKEEHEASVMFQKVQRGRVARAEVKERRKTVQAAKEEQGAGMMQKFERGRKARKKVTEMKEVRQAAREEDASVTFQKIQRGRAAREEVRALREERREQTQIERKREEKERKKMGRNDLDADKVGWDIGGDEYALLGRPLTHAELLRQEGEARRRGEKVRGNLDRKGGQYDDKGEVFKLGNWYGKDVAYSSLEVPGFPRGSTGADVGLNSARSEEMGEDEIPKELKEARYTRNLGRNLGRNHNDDDDYDSDSDAGEDHKDDPPMSLVDRWDWESYFGEVEESVKETKPVKKLSELDELENRVKENRRRGRYEERAADEHRRKLAQGDLSMPAGGGASKHKVIPICMRREPPKARGIGRGRGREGEREGEREGKGKGEKEETKSKGKGSGGERGGGGAVYVQRLRCTVSFEKFVYFQVPVLDPSAVVTVVVRGLEDEKVGAVAPPRGGEQGGGGRRWLKFPSNVPQILPPWPRQQQNGRPPHKREEALKILRRGPVPLAWNPSDVL